MRAPWDLSWFPAVLAATSDAVRIAIAPGTVAAAVSTADPMRAAGATYTATEVASGGVCTAIVTAIEDAAQLPKS